ncbi:hypothetical protein SD70_12760 [Gordoniibacillus kamchatkensis]|uniref:Uncharacterized protein n=1 Tax=Gordoniibacillus kamchatkensis TaxID=1590651 RepID=A0ABR5AHV9_9BACL|nr:hypothetical protein [Paenibacillus sp. VKM B-2647]KIL40601.1 hypothetical protein SD70_12760 [Paenibacillus sp. VKM B-2647]
MERIFPITEEAVMPHIGRCVCAVLHDGTHYYGTLEGVDGGHLIINGYVQRAGEVATYAVKKKQPRKKQKEVKTSAFFPGFGFSRFFLPFASLAFLFALPFFFI